MMAPTTLLADSELLLHFFNDSPWFPDKRIAGEELTPPSSRQKHEGIGAGRSANSGR
jgi:hypothetical protein